MDILTSTVLFVVAGLFLAFVIWPLIKVQLSIGPVYDKARKDLEIIRQDMHGTRPAYQDIEQFNRLAKRLRVSKY